MAVMVADHEVMAPVEKSDRATLARPPRPRRRTVLALLLTGTLLAPAGPAAADIPAPPGVASPIVPAVVAAYGQVGTLGVAVTRQVGRPGTPGAPVAACTGAGVGAADEGSDADRPFPTASLVKLFVAEDVLHRARMGLLPLTGEDLVLLQDMIRRSDDAAASRLWVRYGGGRMVADVAARYGLTGTTPPASPGQWGSTITTARDVACFLARLPGVAHPADARALMSWMRTAAPVAADGFDQRFGLLGAVPGLPAVKQGWMCCLGGKRHLHSVGVVGSRVVVLLSEVSRSVGYEAGAAALSAAAAVVPPPPQPLRR
jgi:hypothetical protein